MLKEPLNGKSGALLKLPAFLPEVILQCLRWYLRYPISYHNLEEMMIERGVEVDHTTL